MFLAILITILTPLVLYYVYKIYLKPLYRMRFYKQQGISCHFNPFFGNDQNLIKVAGFSSDINTYYKKKSTLNPERLFVFNLYDRPLIVLHDKDLIKEFVSNVDKSWIKRDPWRNSIPDLLVSESLFQLNGDKWKEHRKFITLHFTSENINSAIPDFTRITQKAINFIQPRIGHGKVLLTQYFKEITSQIMCNRLFGKEDALNEARIDGVPITSAHPALLNLISQVTNSKITMLLGVKFVKLGLLENHKVMLNRINQLREIFGTVESAKGSLMYTMKKSSIISESQQIDHAINAYNNAMEPIANTIAMAFFWLWKFPEYEKRVVEEISKYKDDEDFDKKVFLQALIKETLRMHPPSSASFPRVILEDHKLADINLHKGDLIQLEVLYNNYHPDYFIYPDEFYPERWLEKEFKVPPYAFIPFSAGPRVCPVEKLVNLEFMIVVSMLLRAYKVKLDRGYNLELGCGAFNRPIVPMWATLTKREL